MKRFLAMLAVVACNVVMRVLQHHGASDSLEQTQPTCSTPKKIWALIPPNMLLFANTDLAGSKVSMETRSYNSP